MRNLGFEALKNRRVNAIATTLCVMIGLAVGYFSQERALLAFPPNCYLLGSPGNACDCAGSDCGACNDDECANSYTIICAVTWPHAPILHAGSYIQPVDLPCWIEFTCVNDGCELGCYGGTVTDISPITVTTYVPSGGCP